MSSYVVWIGKAFIETALSKGNRTQGPIEVVEGPDPEARIVNVIWKGDQIGLQYDRPVEDPVLRTLAPE